MKLSNRPFVLMISLVAGVAVTWACFSAIEAVEKKQKADPAVERTRKTVRMLDDLYKTMVVLVTEHYVNDPDDLGAGPAALALFDAMKKKGWHEVRLLDATGEPYNETNVANDAFEKEAVKKMKAGDPWYDQVEEKDGKRFLRAATAIPVVMQKCTMCHAHYEDAAEGEAIGLLSYTLPIE